MDVNEGSVNEGTVLIEAGEGAEAFFLARSLLTSGESWAAEWMEKAKELL